MELDVLKKKYKLIEDLALRAKSGDGQSNELLFNMLRPLINSTAFKYAKYGIEDAVQDSYIVMMTCINSFDPLKGPFLAYFKNNLRYFMLTNLKNQHEALPIEETVLSDADMVDDILGKIQYRELINAVLKLNERQRDIIIGYYFKGLSLKELSRLYGKHYQTIVKLKERALKNLYDRLS